MTVQLETGMRVRAIEDMRPYLTRGKEYAVVEANRVFVRIMSDFGTLNALYPERFKPIVRVKMGRREL